MLLAVARDGSLLHNAPLEFLQAGVEDFLRLRTGALVLDDGGLLGHDPRTPHAELHQAIGLIHLLGRAEIEVGRRSGENKDQ